MSVFHRSSIRGHIRSQRADVERHIPCGRGTLRGRKNPCFANELVKKGSSSFGMGPVSLP